MAVFPSKCDPLRSQVYTGSVGAENLPYFVAHPAKNSETSSSLPVALA
jgi:hypothetical protein